MTRVVAGPVEVAASRKARSALRATSRGAAIAEHPLLLSLGMTFIWLPAFIAYPRRPVTRIFTFVWGVVFGGTMFTGKFVSGIVDLVYERKGWPLR